MIEKTSKTVAVGNVFGRFTVLGIFREHDDTKRTYVRAQCSCGSPPKYVRLDGLKDGKSKSCGCLQREAVTTHGAWGNPLFNVWSMMIRRCNKPTDHRYYCYGGRGIKVCERWLNVNNFISDMQPGYEKGLQIDRINNDGNYEPSNCKWSTTKQQSRNSRRNVILEHDGKRLCIADWSIETGINAKVLYDRIAHGWTAKKALTQPIKS